MDETRVYITRRRAHARVCGVIVYIHGRCVLQSHSGHEDFVEFSPPNATEYLENGNGENLRPASFKHRTRLTEGLK